MNHTCKQSDIWDQRAGEFVFGCIECLQPSDTTLLSDCFLIPVSPAKKALMELVQSKGHQVDTDGSETVVFRDGGMFSIWPLVSSDEIDAITAQHGKL